MSYVYRSKKEINISDIKLNNEYIREHQKKTVIIKDFEKQSSQFKSNTKRIFEEKNNNPGPDSYEKHIMFYDILNNYYKNKKKPLNIYDKVKMGIIPEEMLNFVKKNQGVAFNTRGGRFNYKNEELEKEKKLPGPASYSPNTSTSYRRNHSNEKTDDNKGNIINTSMKHNISSVESKSYNDKINSNRFIKKNKSFNPELRTESIPSKGNCGYDYDINGNKKMVTLENEVNYLSGEKNNSVGPGDYDLELNWKKNFINWAKTQDDKDEKYNVIKARKNSPLLTQLEKEFLMNSQNNKPKDEAKNNQKKRIFNSLNNRYDKIKLLNKEKTMNELFNETPGPGYYNLDNNTDLLNNYSLNNKLRNSFNSKTKRFKTIYKNNNDLGPGFYYNKSKPKKIEKPNIILRSISNLKNKDKKLSALLLSYEKKDYNVPGPGSYEIKRDLIHEDITNNQNFGSNDRRFKISKEISNDYPGPGSYEPTQLFPKSKEIIPKKLYTNYKSDLELMKELDKVPKEEFITPGVGYYNPNIVSSLEYNIKSKINPYANTKNIGFGIQEKKSTSLISKDNNTNVGPGKYCKIDIKYMRQNFAPFNQSNRRFEYEKNIIGSYDQNSYDIWNRQRNNILYY